MATYLGQFADDTRPAESAIGIWNTPDGRWFAHIWRDDFGPCDSARQATRRHDRELFGMCRPIQGLTPNPVFKGFQNAVLIELAAVVVIVAMIVLL